MVVTQIQLSRSYARKFTVGTVKLVRRNLLPYRVVLVVASALGLSACGGGFEIPQFYAPRWDPTVFVAPNPNQFARKDAAFTPVSASDLVDASGNCAGSPQAQSEQAAPALARNVALQMTECEVVRSLGPPASVQIGANERGDRTATLTYPSAERPIYVFTGGRLSTIERSAEPPPEPTRKKPPPKRQQSRQPA
jgi:hypothetical protein